MPPEESSSEQTRDRRQPLKPDASQSPSPKQLPTASAPPLAPALRGNRLSTAKEIREQENEAATGGMRNPSKAIERIPDAIPTGRRVRQALLHAIAEDETLLEPCRARFNRQHTDGFSATQLRSLYSTVMKALGATGEMPSRGISATLLQAWLTSSGDPDTDLPQWLIEGAPLGVSRPITSRGIFPVRPHEARTLYPGLLAGSPHGWTNYRSSEEDPAVCQAILDRMVNNGWASQASSW